MAPRQPRLPATTALLVCLAAGSALAARGPSWGSQAGGATRQAAEGSEGSAVTMPLAPSKPDCTTPKSQPGNCVPLPSCKPLLDLLKTSRLSPRGLPDTEVTQLLRQSHCGFQGNTVMVCCPSEGTEYRGKPSPSSSAPATAAPGNAYGTPGRPAASRPGTGLASAQRPASPQSARPEPESGFEFSTTRPEPHPAPGSSPDRIPDRSPDGAGFGGAASYPAASYPAPSHPASSHPAPSYPEPQNAVHTVSALSLPDPDGEPAGPQDSFPLENLGLLPIEICGLMLHPGSPGNNRTALMQYPWMARLGYRPQGSQGDYDPAALDYLCAGSLISERYVVTAAHCVGVLGGPVSVRLGESDAANNPDCADESRCAPPVVDVAVEEKVVHEEHRRGVSDIALLRLARPVAFSEAVSPICLPVQAHNRPEEDLGDRALTVAGWGKSSPNRRQHAPSRWLMQHRAKVVAQSTCRAAYEALDDVDFDPEKHLCIGHRCYGDSGSPLMLAEGGGAEMMDNRAVLYGVLSYGLPDCALRSSPLVFTKMAHYVNWVVRNLRPNPFVPKDRSSGSGDLDPRRSRPEAGYGGYGRH